MRPASRIDHYLDLIDWDTFAGVFGGDPNFHRQNKEAYRQAWKEHPDRRLSQVLINGGMIDNTRLELWQMEESDYLINCQGCHPSDVLLWGTGGKNGNEPYHYILIRDTETPHIRAILSGSDRGLNRASERYLDAFRKELDRRGG